MSFLKAVFKSTNPKMELKCYSEVFSFFICVKNNCGSPRSPQRFWRGEDGNESRHPSSSEGAGADPVVRGRRGLWDGSAHPVPAPVTQWRPKQINTNKVAGLKLQTDVWHGPFYLKLTHLVLQQEGKVNTFKASFLCFMMCRSSHTTCCLNLNMFSWISLA